MANMTNSINSFFAKTPSIMLVAVLIIVAALMGVLLTKRAKAKVQEKKE